MVEVGELATYFSVIPCYIGAFSIMFLTGYPSPTQKQLVQENILDYYSLPIFASIIYITRIVGLISLPCIMQTNISTNVIAFVNCIIGAIGWILILMAESPYTLISGVGIAGISNGVLIVFINSYVAEISLDSQRRVLSGGLGFGMRIGLFLVYSFGIWLSFRWLAVAGLCLVILFACLMLFVPHSPVWFVRQGLDARAVDTLLYLHGDNFDANTEIQKITNAIASAPMSLRANLNALKDLKVLKPILLVTVVGMFEELGGHPAMMSFSSHILESQQGIDPKLAAIFYPVFLIFGSIVSIGILNRCRLKWLLIVTSSIQALSHFSMAIYYLVSAHFINCSNLTPQLCHLLSCWPIFNLAIYGFCFSLGFGAVLYSLMGIMYTSYKEMSVAITEIILNSVSFLVVFIFYFLLHLIGGFWTFLIFSVIHVISIVVIDVIVVI